MQAFVTAGADTSGVLKHSTGTQRIPDETTPTVALKVAQLGLH